MAQRFDAPKPCRHATAHVSSYGPGGNPVWFLTAEERDRYDSMVRSGQIRIDAADAEARLDARQKMIKRETALKPLGQQYFPKDK